MTDTFQFLLDIVRCQDLFDNTLDVQSYSIVARVAFLGLRYNFTLNKVLIIVQIAIVGSNTEVMPHIFRTKTLFPSHQGFVELLTVSSPDDVSAGVSKELLNAFGEVTDC